MDYRNIETEQEMLQEISKYRGVMLYGAGEVGKYMYHFLKNTALAPKAFLTTKKRSVKTQLEGLPVYQVDETAGMDMEPILVIVSTQEYLHPEILQEMERRHIPHVVCVSDRLYNQIKLDHPRPKLNFQIHVTEHCNLNCKGCYHFSPLAQEEYLSPEEYRRDLERLAELYHGEMDQILLLGGEPLLHPKLAQFLRISRECFPNREGVIKILSNGILVPKLDDAFWDACVETGTQLWLTKYPINIDYEKIGKIAKDHGIDIQYFSYEPVRTLGRQPLDLSGTRDYVENFKNCYRANECVMLDHGRLYPCVIPAEIRHFNTYFHMDLKTCEQDYVDIYKVNSVEELQMLMQRPTPFCRYCDRSDVAVYGCVPWQVSQRNIEEWT